jgi:hypothetical protein
VGKGEAPKPQSTLLPIFIGQYQDRIVMGAERKSQYIGDKEKLMTAYHEV